LIHYINNLNSDIDVIEEQNKNISIEIKRHEQMGDLSEGVKLKFKKMLRQEINEIRSSKTVKES